MAYFFILEIIEKHLFIFTSFTLGLKRPVHRSFRRKR
nr:MAG TPA: hypothetical protein [Caudoviricetes sp.]